MRPDLEALLLNLLKTFNTPDGGIIPVYIMKAVPADHGTDTGWENTNSNGQALFNGYLLFKTSYYFIDGQTWDRGAFEY